MLPTVYVENPVVQAVVNLVIIAGVLGLLTKITMGPSPTAPGAQHPLFGRFTIHVPNAMSLLRFPLALWMLGVHMLPELTSPLWNLSLHFAFWAVSLFDALDGMFARKWRAITEDGKSLDPASDKFVTFSLAICAARFGTELPWWAVAIVVGREVASMLQRARMSRRGVDVSARWLGKIKTGVQFTVLYILILRIGALPGTVGLDAIAQLFPPQLALWGVLLMCFCTIVSLFPFFQSFSYVNAYTQSQGKESNRPWYIVAVPNLFTIGNYLCGVTAVYFAMPTVEVMYKPFVVLYWIMAAAFCDAFDGPMARRLKVNSELGDCLDCSTDLSTFGLAVGVVIFLLYCDMEVHVAWAAFVALAYFISVHLRLARFTQLQQAQVDPSQKLDFVGLPSPSGGFGVLVFLTLFHPIEHLLFVEVAILSLLILGTSWLMYSRYDYLSHSNALKNRFYKWVMIPGIFGGFGMVFVLVFQQPFVSDHFSRELLYYFRACSWMLAALQTVYILDGLRRGRVPPERLQAIA